MQWNILVTSLGKQRSRDLGHCHTSAPSFKEVGLTGNTKVQSNSMTSALAITCKRTSACTQVYGPGCLGAGWYCPMSWLLPTYITPQEAVPPQPGL